MCSHRIVDVIAHQWLLILCNRGLASGRQPQDDGDKDAGCHQLRHCGGAPARLTSLLPCSCQLQIRLDRAHYRACHDFACVYAVGIPEESCSYPLSAIAARMSMPRYSHAHGPV